MKYINVCSECDSDDIVALANPNKPVFKPGQKCKCNRCASPISTISAKPYVEWLLKRMIEDYVPFSVELIHEYRDEIRHRIIYDYCYDPDQVVIVVTSVTNAGAVGYLCPADEVVESLIHSIGNDWEEFQEEIMFNSKPLNTLYDE
jgi:hypothetical protein